MNKLIEHILTNTEARDQQAVESLAVNHGASAAPWNDAG